MTNLYNYETGLTNLRRVLNISRYLLFFAAVSLSLSCYGGTIEFKNEISKKLYLTVAYYKNGKWVTEGWWHIYPGQTKTTITNNINRYVYWYATMDNSYADYEGDCGFRVESNSFTIYNADRSSRGRTEYFKKIDLGNGNGHQDLLFSITNESKCKGNCNDGSGTYYFNDGDKYVGAWKNGKRHGYGTYYFNDGDKYVGTWKNGKRHGYGTYYYTGGSKYKGNWRYGKKHGSGKYTYKDGDYYEGEYSSGKRTGMGKYTWSSGGNWSGEFNDGNFAGYGVRTYSDGSKKKGIWVNNEWKYHCNLRLVLVMNTNNIRVGANGEKTESGLKDFYREVAKVGKMKFKYKVIDGSSFTKSNVKRYVENFDCEKNDVVVFHYFGHGGRTNNTSGKWPLMKLAANGGSLEQDGLSLEYIKMKMYNQSPARLGLFYADCCNTTLTEPEECTPESNYYLSKDAISRWAVEKLFVEKKGVIMASSSSIGQFSTTNNGGSSIYTMAFYDSMHEYLDDYSSEWSDIMSSIKSEVHDLTKNCEYNNTKQTPQYSIWISEAK